MWQSFLRSAVGAGSVKHDDELAVFGNSIIEDCVLGTKQERQKQIQCTHRDAHTNYRLKGKVLFDSQISYIKKKKTIAEIGSTVP